MSSTFLFFLRIILNFQLISLIRICVDKSETTRELQILDYTPVKEIVLHSCICMWLSVHEGGVGLWLTFFLIGKLHQISGVLFLQSWLIAEFQFQLVVFNACLYYFDFPNSFYTHINNVMNIFPDYLGWESNTESYFITWLLCLKLLLHLMLRLMAGHNMPTRNESFTFCSDDLQSRDTHKLWSLWFSYIHSVEAPNWCFACVCSSEQVHLHSYQTQQTTVCWIYIKWTAWWRSG